VITVISLSHSFGAALAALGFLIVVHKLEYFINARIVGTQINARAWEILLWMLVMERLFGLIGVVAAPVFYAWLKAEWQLWDKVEQQKVDLNQG
jgi:predicted PurR-regulated permease PerM